MCPGLIKTAGLRLTRIGDEDMPRLDVAASEGRDCHVGRMIPRTMVDLFVTPLKATGLVPCPNEKTARIINKARIVTLFLCMLLGFSLLHPPS